MYALVNDVESYREFLPWCRASRVLESDGNRMRAEIEMSLAGFSRRFSTENTLTPGRHIQVQLVNGPFRHLEGNWSFDPLGPEACKVSVEMEFQVANSMFEFALAHAFERVCNSMVDSFTKRAAQVHGRS